MKIPKKLRGSDCIHIAQFCVYTGNLRVAARVATKASKKDGITGFAIENGERVYYCLLGFKNDPAIYATK